MATSDVWDVVRVPFPYTNRPVQQRRPALVVASNASHGAPYLLWVIMITSAGNRAWPGDVEVSDLAQAGLPAASVVRSVKLATVRAADAERIGSLPRADRAAVVRHVERCLSPLLQQ